MQRSSVFASRVLEPLLMVVLQSGLCLAIQLSTTLGLRIPSREPLQCVRQAICASSVLLQQDRRCEVVRVSDESVFVTAENHTEESRLCHFVAETRSQGSIEPTCQATNQSTCVYARNAGLTSCESVVVHVFHV